MVAALPLLASLVSLFFALAVLDQFFARRKPYQLVWASGLLMYCIATGAEFATEVWGLNPVAYRLWYLFGAILVAAYLGMGTLYLLAPRRASRTIMLLLVAVSVYAAWRVFSASGDLEAITYLSGRALPQGVRLLTPLFNTFGTVALVGGALYSAWVFWRRRLMRHRVISNLLIAVGAILPALGGGLSRFGTGIELTYLLELLGIIIIFAGFLRSREIFGLYRIPLVHGFGKVPARGEQ